MQNQKQPKLFAFQLAQQRNKDSKPADQWKVRDGVSVAGCTLSDEWGNYRDAKGSVADAGIYC